MENKSAAIGTCQSEEIIEQFFGSVSEFARQVEEKGDNFTHKQIVRVEYDEKKDVHYFFLV
jgi:hypothetical protein